MAITVGPNIIKFKNKHTIYENEIVCRVSATELNMSQNPTITTDNSGSLREGVSGGVDTPHNSRKGWGAIFSGKMVSPLELPLDI